MTRLIPLVFVLLLSLVFGAASAANASPLRVVLIPADGGTDSGTLSDFRPVFDAVSRSSGLRFELRVAQSYAAAVGAVCAGSADLAFFGAVTYVQARRRGCAELLAVAVDRGRSEYQSGLFVLQGDRARALGDLRHRRLALGDVNSTTAFVYPVALLLGAGLNPAQDLAEIRLTGSHAASLRALTSRRVDAAALSIESFNKALSQGWVRADQVRLLAISDPIPNPPLAMRKSLPDDIKIQLKRAFGGLAREPGVTKEMIRGYGGKLVDGYDADYPEARFDAVERVMDRVDGRHREAIIRRAALPG